MKPIRWRESLSSNQGSSAADFEPLGLRYKEDPMVRKIGFDLASLHQEYVEHLERGGTAESFESSNPLMPVHQGRVVMDLVATENPDDLLADLEALGLKEASVFGSTVSAVLSIEELDELADMENLKFARAAIVQTNVGSTTSQGDVAMRADVARATFGVDGSGVTLGVLSDSYDNLGGAVADVTSGDLPGPGNPEGNRIPVNVLEDLPSGGSDEGRAMLQLVHDVAPGAELAFNTAAGGQASFANGIINLADVAGADVIVDDIIYLAEPMFQDGIIAQAVDTVVADGASYFSSAGNNARDAYESAFEPSGLFEPIFGGELHDFDPGSGVDVFQGITVPEGAQLIVSFQWDEPFFSVSGGAGSSNDLDIFLFDSTGTNVLAGSAAPNIGGDPVEVFEFTNDGSFGTDQFNIAFSNFDGPDPSFMKYVLFDSGGDVTIDEFDTTSGTVYGHANANGAEATGAAFYQDTPEFGQAPALLESFSSAGPTPILFETDGTRTFEERFKPEIVGPDGTNTTFFGFDIEPDGFPNFFGTSASAPHAAAVAALMLEAAPDTSPAEIYAALENTALDIDTPGPDFHSGFGFIQADSAIQEVLVPHPGAIEIEAEDLELVNYRVEENEFASGGELIEVQGQSGTTGTASTEFTGSSGLYEIVIGYFDDNDGDGLLQFSVNDNLIDNWSLDQDLGFNIPNTQTFQQRTIGGVELAMGDTLTIQGTRNSDDFTRVDFLKLLPRSIFDVDSSSTGEAVFSGTGDITGIVEL